MSGRPHRWSVVDENPHSRPKDGLEWGTRGTRWKRVGREHISGGKNFRGIMLHSRGSDSVRGCSFQHTGFWLSLPAAVMVLALALATPATAQSQPAQSNTAPCSDAPPTLKRGAQPELPPCPAPPAEEAPARSLTPSEALIERARAAAFQFAQKLPNFVCQEFMSRYIQRGRGEKRPWTWFRRRSFTRTGRRAIAT